MFYHEKDSKNLSIDLTLLQEVNRATPTTSMLFDINSISSRGGKWEEMGRQYIVQPVQ